MSRKKITKTIFSCDIDDQNIKYVYASKGTQAVFLNLNLSIFLRYSANLKIALEDTTKVDNASLFF